MHHTGLLKAKNKKLNPDQKKPPDDLAIGELIVRGLACKNGGSVLIEH